MTPCRFVRLMWQMSRPQARVDQSRLRVLMEAGEIGGVEADEIVNRLWYGAHTRP